MVAIGLSTLGLACLPTGVFGAVLGALELRAIQRDEAPPAGESFARVAIWVGLVETLALLVWLLYTAFAE